ncbi:tetratricopeptide repeat protein [Gemmata sp.]|uniref:tetratricopeptide repeat protein n=1 Tax=Gemmata sp. TaxID=1914242 RepID=UPI003F715286
MTSWHRNEYILKGVFLGLWVFFALQVPGGPTDAWVDIAWVVGWVCAGLAVGLAAGTALQVSRGLRPWHNWVAFPLMVLLESPTFIYAGIVSGLLVGVLSGTAGAEPWAGDLAGAFGLTFADIRHTPPAGEWLGYCAFGGAVLGLALYRFRQVPDRTRRFWIGLGVAALMVYLADQYVARVPGLDDPARRFNLGAYILLGLPFFYLLTFCGESEESEVEIMTFCAALGVGLHLMGFAKQFPGLGAAAPFLIPVTLYFVYATRIMPGLRVFKHVLRGYGYMNLGRLTLAVQFFNRALELDPRSPLAGQGLVALHNNLTLSQIDSDPQLVSALDFTLCLDRATALLMPAGTVPTPTQRAEAERFLSLVEQKKPAYLAQIDYLRVVSLMHAKQYDAAAETLARLLSPETPGYHPVVRGRVLFDAWDLALRLHPKLVERLGWDELNKPGRRMELIAATERKLAAEPTNPAAKEYRTMLYAQLAEGEFIAAAAAGRPKDFSFEYVEQLGLALVDDADPDRRERGMGYMRIAGRGLPDKGPGIFVKLAQVYDKHGDAENARKSYESAKQVGLAVGPRELYRDQKAFYTDALRKLAALAEAKGNELLAAAEEAAARGDADGAAGRRAEAHAHFETAIAEWRQYLEDGGPAALDAYRKLAEFYGKTGDALNALLMTETGLTYSSTDTDLLKKKDTFYYSVEPERLEKVKDRVVRWFDVSYCVKKAMSVLNTKDGGADLLDWAAHLSALARVMKPTSNGVRLIEARVLLRKGERDAGVAILEDVREAEKGSGEEQEAWYTTTKLLGQLYLEEFSRPDLALKCYSDYKDYHKSGADTIYQIAKCYEAQGDTPNAIKFYSAVTAYEGHTLYWDAKEALRRLGKE